MSETVAEPGSAYETIRVTRDGAVAIVELHRPESLNAISIRMGQELLTALRQIARDREVGAVVLTGAGRGFNSGADLRDVGAEPRSRGVPTSPRACARR